MGECCERTGLGEKAARGEYVARGWAEKCASSILLYTVFIAHLGAALFHALIRRDSILQSYGVGEISVRLFSMRRAPR